MPIGAAVMFVLFGVIIASVVNIFLAYDVRIFYVASLNSVDPGSGIHFVLDRAQHLALPIIVLAVANIARSAWQR